MHPWLLVRVLKQQDATVKLAAQREALLQQKDNLLKEKDALLRARDAEIEQLRVAAGSAPAAKVADCIYR